MHVVLFAMDLVVVLFVFVCGDCLGARRPICRPVDDRPAAEDVLKHDFNAY